MEAKPRILCVDDEERVLEGLKLTLRRQFRVDAAISGEAGLALLKGASSDPYSVIVSDMRMPRMNGAEFLSAAKLQSPDSVRVLLTGHSDLESAISAVNN